MKIGKSALWTMILAAGISVAGSITSMASDKVISSITIRVNTKLEPGDTLPTIQIANAGEDNSVSDGGVCVSVSDSKYRIYEAQWVTSEDDDVEVGDKPSMKVWLAPVDTDTTDYYFKGTYRSSNVTIRNGTYSSADREDEDSLMIRLRVDPVEGKFGEPEDAYWKDNARATARWEAPEEGDTGKYEVVLKRGSSTVHDVETTATSYNFYPYMTREGTYYFRVRTIAKSSSESEYGKSSDWVESEEMYLAEEDVSDGTDNGSASVGGGPGMNSGVSGTVSVPGVYAQAGWYQNNGFWYYYYPDGSYQRDSWLKLGEQWFLFNEAGQLLYGWQQRNGQTYYLQTNGVMATGWLNDNGRWYYLNPTKDAFEGAMLAERWLSDNGMTYFLTADGTRAEGWWRINDRWYYFYPGQGNMAVNAWIGNFYVGSDGVWNNGVAAGNTGTSGSGSASGNVGTSGNTGASNNSGVIVTGPSAGSTGVVNPYAQGTWQQSDGYWYYRHADGHYQRNDWLQVGDKRFLFDQAGRMLRGWQQRNNQTYYFKDNGEMVTGWLSDSGRWYYLNPTKDAFEGAMLAERWLADNGMTYFLTADGTMAEGWWRINDLWYYFYPGQGNMAVNTWIGSFYVGSDGVWR